MAMHVISPGPRTTIQDKGRLGYQNSGFAPSGFMDRVASRMANVLVGNKDSEAVLEFRKQGFRGSVGILPDRTGAEI